MAKSTLRLDVQGTEAKEWFLLARKELVHTETLVCMAVLVYAVYTTTNRLRKMSNRDPELAAGALEQNVREAVRNHLPSERVVNNRWAEHGARQKRQGVEQGSRGQKRQRRE